MTLKLAVEITGDASGLQAAAKSAQGALDDVAGAAGRTGGALGGGGGSGSGGSGGGGGGGGGSGGGGVAGAADRASDRMRQLRAALQQAGYQVQDFAVQVQSGQSALVAFVQQGSQLAGIFGPAGAIAGAVLAVGGIALQMAGVGQATEDTEAKAKRLADAFKSVRDGLTGAQRIDPFAFANANANVDAAVREAERKRQEVLRRRPVEDQFIKGTSQDGRNNIDRGALALAQRDFDRSNRAVLLEPTLLRATAGQLQGGDGLRGSQGRELADAQAAADARARQARANADADAAARSAIERRFANDPAGRAAELAALERRNTLLRETGDATSAAAQAEVARAAAVARQVAVDGQAVAAARRLVDLRDQETRQVLERATAGEDPASRAETLARLDRAVQLRREGVDVTSAAARAEIDLAGAVARGAVETRAAVQQAERLRDLRDDLATAEAEAALATAPAAARAEALAAIQAELRLRREGIDLTSDRAREEIGLARTIAATRAETQRQQAILQDLAQTVEQSFDTVGKSITDAFIQGRASAVTFGSVVQGVLSQVLSQLLRISVVNPVLNGLFGGSRAMIGDVGGLIGSLFSGGGGAGGPATTSWMGFGGGRANGGPVSPGQFYVVGERGPEILIPGSGGTVIPNGAGGGNVTVNVINQSAAGVDVQQSPDGRGGMRIDVMIRDEVRRQIAGGAFDAQMRGRFGLSPSGQGARA